MDRNQPFVVDQDRVAHNDFGDEVVVIHFATGNYFSLRGTAALLWKCLSQGPASSTSLLSLFADPPAEAVDLLIAFLGDFSARGLVVEAVAGEEPSVAKANAVFEPPRIEAFEDLQALLIADVIHDTDEQGWPHIAVDPAA